MLCIALFHPSNDCSDLGDLKNAEQMEIPEGGTGQRPVPLGYRSVIEIIASWRLRFSHSIRRQNQRADCNLPADMQFRPCDPE